MLSTRKSLEAPARLDAYTGMLAVSLGAMAIAGVLLLIDYSSYPTAKPEEPAAPEALKSKPAPSSTTPTPTVKG
jgi:hypothetical protein